tara:strand:- start:1209 stop:1802 length:594 start_codon:yes stop_codon:yes gene_type:complete
MRSCEAFASILAIILLAAPVVAHEPKEYTILMKDDGVTPNGVQQGILVTTDYLFFYNVDSRENTSHRVLIDADSDGNYNGSDDISTAWLFSSCELNETGQKEDPECEVTELVLLDPSNGLLPGNISMMHQIIHNGNSSESVFVVTFSADVHMTQPIQNTDSGDEASTESNDSLLKLVLLFSLMGMAVILPKLLSEKR